MCFSTEASFGASAVLIGTGLLIMKKNGIFRQDGICLYPNALRPAAVLGGIGLAEL